MIVIHDVNHAVLKQFSSKLTVPMFPASSTVYAYQRVISDMMTFQEKFNRLNGLTLAWIGPPTPIFNTYLSLCPLLGIKIRYHCFCIVSSYPLLFLFTLLLVFFLVFLEN